MLLNFLILTVLVLLREIEGRVERKYSSSISDDQATKPTRFPREISVSEAGQAQWTTTVTSKDGKLRGSVMKSRKNKDYIAFRGIQYAEVKGRFQASMPPTSWINIKDALEFGPDCPQCTNCGYTVERVHEDCLYLNVYVPDLKPTQKELAVLMFVHDGYYHGTGSAFGADYFMDEDIILVTINYRLGTLGFLNTGDGIVPGNNGLRDMIMALNWIDRNIKDFSGDQIRITVFGESGSAPHLLMLSPAAKDLVRGVIVPSQSALSLHVFSQPARANKLLADKTGCPSSPTEEFLKCLTNLDLEVLISAQQNISTGGIGFEKSLFCPSVDSTLNGKPNKRDGVIPETPYELIMKGAGKDIPMILGIVENEALVARAYTLRNKTLMETFNKNLSALIEFLQYDHVLPKYEILRIGKQLKKIYFGNENISKSNIALFQEMVAHVLAQRPIRLAAELHSLTNSRLFLYIFVQKGTFSWASRFGIYKEGPTSGDEMYYLFPHLKKPQFWPVTIHPADVEFSKKFVGLYASFVKTGKPTLYWNTKWSPLQINEKMDSKVKIPWYSIGPEPMEMEFTSVPETRYRFTNELLSYYETTQISWNAGD